MKSVKSAAENVLQHRNILISVVFICMHLQTVSVNNNHIIKIRIIYTSTTIELQKNTDNKIGHVLLFFLLFFQEEFPFLFVFLHVTTRLAVSFRWKSLKILHFMMHGTLMTMSGVLQDSVWFQENWWLYSRLFFSKESRI